MADLWATVTGSEQYQRDYAEGQRCRKKEYVKRLILDLAEPSLDFEDFPDDEAVRLWELLAEGVDDLILLIQTARRPLRDQITYAEKLVSEGRR